MSSVDFIDVRRVICGNTGIDLKNINEGTNFADLGLDSLGLYELRMAVNDEFGCEISDEDTNDIGTVGELCQWLSSR